MPPTKSLVLVLICVVARGAAAQSFNINFGPVGSGPSSTYAAAGQAGIWNSVPGVPGTTYSLVAVDGNATNVTISQSPSTTLLTGTDPSVTGNDAALLNHALITYNATAETCLAVNGLQPGDYEVILYLWTPSAPTVLSRGRQDLSTTTYNVGGAWTGSHVEGVTYARWILPITGFLGSHSGIPAGDPAQNGAALNGIQIRQLGGDAGVLNNPDAGAVGPDAGSTPVDSGSIAADASPAGRDASIAGADAAAPTSDAGASGSGGGCGGCSSTGAFSGVGALLAAIALRRRRGASPNHPAA